MKAATHHNGYEFAIGSGYELPHYPFVPPPGLTSGQAEAHEVVIVGGGLSGLTLACALSALGQKAVLLDEDHTVGVKGASSRGICYTQKSLEIFDRLGLYERVASKGIRWSVGRTFAGQDEVMRFNLAEQLQFNLSAQPPFINIQQFYVEGFLAERTMALHAQKPQAAVDLRWGSRVVGMSAGTGGTELEVETPEGRYALKARYVVDATGTASTLRRLLKVPFETERGDDRWCIADIRFKNAPPLERHTWIEAPFNEGRAVWQHKMADEVWRIDYQMAPGADAAYVSREDVVRERLAKQFGSADGIELVWVGPYAYRSELAARMAVALGDAKAPWQAAAFLIGDTAKVVSPFGARGGNTGISDADNLAWKLAAVCQGRAAPALLKSFHDERHEAARVNVQVTRRTARFLRPTDGAERVLRTAAIALAKRHAFARPLINTGRMAVANAYSDSGACPGAHGGGASVQNAAFTWANGTSGQLHHLLHWAEGNLLLLVWHSSVLSKADAQRLAEMTNASGVRVVQVLPHASTRAAREQVADAQNTLARACGLHIAPSKAPPDTTWALIRPDAYLAQRGQGIHAHLIQAIQAALGTNA